MNKSVVLLICCALVLAVTLSISSEVLASPARQGIPTYTPAATPTYRATLESSSSRETDPGGGSSALGNLLQLGTQTKTQMDSINLMFDKTIDDTALRIHAYSPLPLLRGAAIVFADFDWLVKLVGWFIFAAIVIILVSAVRFFISAWGIIQRLLELIKAIPFI